VSAGTEGEIDTAFVALAQKRVDALVIITDPLFNSRPDNLAALATRHALPAIYPYAGRILKGEKPADLPVQQSTKLTVAINLKAAKALGLTVPDKLLTLADEVIE